MEEQAVDPAHHEATHVDAHDLPHIRELDQNRGNDTPHPIIESAVEGHDNPIVNDMTEELKQLIHRRLLMGEESDAEKAAQRSVRDTILEHFHRYIEDVVENMAKDEELAREFCDRFNVNKDVLEDCLESATIDVTINYD